MIEYIVCVCRQSAIYNGLISFQTRDINNAHEQDNA